MWKCDAFRQTDLSVYASLRELRKMDLTLETLKVWFFPNVYKLDLQFFFLLNVFILYQATGIGKSVNALRKHKSANIQNLAKKMVEYVTFFSITGEIWHTSPLDDCQYGSCWTNLRYEVPWFALDLYDNSFLKWTWSPQNLSAYVCSFSHASQKLEWNGERILVESSSSICRLLLLLLPFSILASKVSVLHSMFVVHYWSVTLRVVNY